MINNIGNRWTITLTLLCCISLKYCQAHISADIVADTYIAVSVYQLTSDRTQQFKLRKSLGPPVHFVHQ